MLCNLSPMREGLPKVPREVVRGGTGEGAEKPVEAHHAPAPPVTDNQTHHASGTLPAMGRLRAGLIAWFAMTAVFAQAPAEERAARDQAIHRGQLQAGAAYRDLQQARHNAKLAEQDYLNAVEAQRAAQQHAEAAKRRMDGAKQALDAVRKREAQAGKRYSDALDAVERASRQPPPK